MVQTRSMAAGGGGLQRMVNEIQRLRRGRRWVKRYKPTDHAHRHRLNDRQPKSETVRTYQRRT